MQLSLKARKAAAIGLAASTVLWASASALVPQIASAAVHSDGCLVLSGGVVWSITGGTRRGFTSAEVFMSHGYNFSQVIAASAEDAALPVGPIMVYANGTLVMGPNDPLVYLVVNGQKRGFTTGAVFTGLGYSFANIQVAPVNTFSDLPTGANINSTSITGLPAGGPGPQTVTCTTGGDDGNLQGGAGDLTLTSTSTDVKDSVKEGENNVNIFGVKAEADGSDIAINSVKVSFTNCEVSCTSATVDSSENLAKYIDTVAVYLGDTKVGSADVEDFNKDTDSPDVFSKTITLSNAVVQDQENEKLYVAVSALGNIDTDDIDNASWGVQLETMRYRDATGAILTADVSDFDTYAENDEFTFDDSSTDDQIDLKSSSANPDDSNVQVDENANSDSTLDLAFKLDVDPDSQDVDVTSMTFTVDFVGLDTDNDGDITGETSTSDSAADAIIDSMVVKIGGNSYDADLDSGSVDIDGSGDGTATYTADINDLTIGSDDVEEGKTYVTFNDADNYNEDEVTVQVSLANEDVSAETADDELPVTGTDQDGAVLTPTLSGATVEVTDTSHSQNTDGNLGTFTFEVTITADGADVDVDAASIVETLLGGTDTSYTSLSVVNLDGDATENGANDYTVSDGDSNTFSITYTHDPDAAGAYYVRLDSIDGVVVDELVGPESLAAS